MTQEIKKIEFNVEKDPAKPSNIVVAEYFVSNVDGRPTAVDIICRFKDPRDEKKYEIKHREVKEIIERNPERIEIIARETVQQFFLI